MNKSKIRLLLFTIILVIVSIIILPKIFSKNTTTEERKTTEISYTEFLQEIQNYYIDTIYLEKDSTKAEASFEKKATNESGYYSVELPSQEIFFDYIQQEFYSDLLNIRASRAPKIIIEDNTSNNLISVLTFLPTILYIMIILFIFNAIYKKSKNGGTFQSITGLDGDGYKVKAVSSKYRFSDIAGLDEEIQEVQEIVDFLKNPEKYQALGAKIPKGLLLSGDPGTGKTLLAKAIAGEAGVNFLYASGSEFVEKYVGVGASRIRKLFEEAKNNAPCIIFIDEIDAIGCRRDNDNSEHHQTLDQLLTELDGFLGRSDIIIMGATNKASHLDPALTRPGRFDRKIEIRLPDMVDREKILQIHSKNKPLAEDVNFKHIALNTAGYSGSELENLINEAALVAARKGHSYIIQQDIDDAWKKLVVGLEKTGRIISDKEKKITATHEAGHALVEFLSKFGSQVKEISIIPRGKAGGYTWSSKSDDTHYVSKEELKGRISVLLAGRSAEKILLGDISSGSSQDIEEATKIARNMVLLYGMDNDIGPVSVNALTISETELIGGDYLSQINFKISKILKDIEEETIRLLKRYPKELDTIIKELLEKETISGEELNNIFKKESSTSDE